MRGARFAMSAIKDKSHKEIFTLRGRIMVAGINLENLILEKIRMYLSTTSDEENRNSSGRNERGDVPGWVLVVLMTAGLVTGIWTVAAPRLNQILRTSLDSMNSIR